MQVDSKMDCWVTNKEKNMETKKEIMAEMSLSEMENIDGGVVITTLAAVCTVVWVAGEIAYQIGKSMR